MGAKFDIKNIKFRYIQSNISKLVYILLIWFVVLWQYYKWQRNKRLHWFWLKIINGRF